MNAKARAMANPDEILAIVIDGSDQSSYATPYFSQVTRESCKGWRLRLKLIGALVTGRLLQFFTLASNWESGTCMRLFCYQIAGWILLHARDREPVRLSLWQWACSSVPVVRDMAKDVP